MSDQPSTEPLHNTKPEPVSLIKMSEALRRVGRIMEKLIPAEQARLARCVYVMFAEDRGGKS